jgi:general secretion pathway protein G
MKINLKKLITHYSPLAPKTQGYTFIEILVVITIIGILATIGMVSYQSANKKSRDGKRQADIEQLRTGLEMYRADNGYYPGSLSSIVSSGYMTVLPTPPKTTDCTTGSYADCYSASGCAAGQCSGYGLTITLESPPSSYTKYNP